MPPTIAVIIAAQPHDPALDATLASVAAQLHAASEIVVVVDGGDDDGEMPVARAATARPATAIRVVRGAPGGARVAAWNAGIDATTADYVLCLEAGDLLSPLHLHAAARAIAADPGIDLAWSDTIVYDATGQRGAPVREWDVVHEAEVELPPCATLYRRAALARVGGYRSEVGPHADWDLRIALAATGARGHRLPFPHFHAHAARLAPDAATVASDLAHRAAIVERTPSSFTPETRALARLIRDGAPFDAMTAWARLDDILRTGCLDAARAAADEALAWARAVVAAGAVETERGRLETLVATGAADLVAVRRLGALFVESGDGVRGMSLLLLAWSTTTRARTGSVAVPARDTVPATASAPVIAAPFAPGDRPVRVLCWMPYGQWSPHAQQEMTILNGARWRGAEVRYVLCDGAFRECDAHWAATSPRPDGACVGCRARQARQAHDARLPHEWLGRHVSDAERAMAAEWAATLPVESLVTASWNGWAIGAWIVSSVHSHHRTNHVDPHDPVHEATLRAYLEAGLLVAFAMDRLLAAWRPDVVLLFNGRLSGLRVAFELARAAGIRVVTHERGWRNETLYLAENADCLSVSPIRDAWPAWRDVPLTAEEFGTTAQWLHDRAHGRGLNWNAFTEPPGALEAVRSALGLRPTAPLAALFTSSEDEYIACPDYASPFGTQERWLQATLAWAHSRPDVDLVVRVHPNTGGKVSHGANHGQLAWLRRLATEAPANVRFVWPDDAISSYALMTLAPLGLSYVSTVALEHACRGGIAVAAASSAFSGHGFTEDIADPSGYAARLDALLAEADPARALARRTLAWRFAHYAVHRYMVSFPLVPQPTHLTATLAYDGPDALRPGRDAGLDRVTGILLDGRAVCPPPTAAERTGRDADTERALHASLAGAARPAALAERVA